MDSQEMDPLEDEQYFNSVVTDDKKHINLEPTESVDDNIKIELIDFAADEKKLVKPMFENQAINNQRDPQKLCDNDNLLSIKTEYACFNTEEENMPTKNETSAFKSLVTNSAQKTCHTYMNAHSEITLKKTESNTAIVAPIILESNKVHNSPASVHSEHSLELQQQDPPLFAMSAVKKRQRSQSIQTKPNEHKDKEKFDAALIKLLTIDLHNITFAQNIGFKEFVKACQPSYILPSLEKISEKINKEYNATIQSLKSLMQCEAMSVCISVETWASLDSEIYQSVTAHFLIQNTMELKSVLLDCYYCGTESFSAEDASYAPCEILDAWNLHGKVNFIVYDGCDVIAEAYSKYIKAPYFTCYARTLSNIVKSSLTELEPTTKKLRSQAILWDNLKYDENIEDDLSGFSACIESPTWLYMLKIVTEKYDDILENIKQYEKQKNIKYEHMLTQEEIQMCRELHSLMKPFEEVIQFMCSSKYLTAGMPIVITCILLKFLIRARVQPYSDVVTRVVDRLVEKLKDIVPTLEDNEVLRMCTFLDPRFKIRFFVSDSTVGIVKNSVLRLMLSNMNESETSNSNTVTPTLTSVWSIFDSTAKKESVEVVANREIDRYLDMDLALRDSSPYIWWKQHNQIFPNLTKLFQNHFGCVGSCSPCANVFTEKGKTLNTRRSELDEEYVRELLFLHVNTELDTSDNVEISALYLKKHIIDSLNTLFGEVGASIPVDILKYEPTTKRSILRVPEEFYVKLYSSLTLCGKYQNILCAYRVHKTTPSLLSLLGDSRTHKF